MVNKVYQDMEIIGNLTVDRQLETAGGGTLGTNLTKELRADRYDVGDIVVRTNNVSPAAKYGGTWTQIKDVFLLAAGDTYAAGSTGGSANAVVVEHNHILTKSANTGIGGIMDDGRTIQRGYSGGTPNVLNWSDLYGIQSAGESGTGKNMPPYLAAYIWQKIA